MLKNLKNLIKMNKFPITYTYQIDSRKSKNLKRLIITEEMEMLLITLQKCLFHRVMKYISFSP